MVDLHEEKGLITKLLDGSELRSATLAIFGPGEPYRKSALTSTPAGALKALPSTNLDVVVLSALEVDTNVNDA